MRRVRPFVILLVLPLCACAVASSEYSAIDSCLDGGKAWNYRSSRCETSDPGPVDLIRVDKSEHLMTVFRKGHPVREFRVALGRGDPGPKQQQGDGRVPEGSYRITAHNPNSAFHLSLRIGYPTAQQIAAAARLGVRPGGDIMIHGLPNDRGRIGSRHTSVDWTEGCVAVTNREMDWLYTAVSDGTPVEISG
ncbi:MAG TPA: L,D-transpeptidase family protein [Sphingomicrobium sp.]|nr:L,D-transpeptidase family protein [Sphingomicrobium sp.]